MLKLSFCYAIIAQSNCKTYKTLYLSNISLYAQNSRISSQRILVRSARSFERLEMQILFALFASFCIIRYFLYIRIVIENNHEHGTKIISFRHTDILGNPHE